MRAALLALTLLAGCSSAGSDGYRYEESEFERETVTVTVVTHPSIAALRKEADRLNIADGDRELQAFAIIAPDRSACTIHIVEPARSNDRIWPGHEFTHCIRGRWHG